MRGSYIQDPLNVYSGTSRSTLFDRNLFFSVLSAAAVTTHYAQLLNKLPSQSAL